MKRSKFSLSNYKLLSCEPGELIPCGLFEVLPGDSIQQSTNALLRTQPLLAPIMHPVNVRIHHWFVPFRLIWDDWEDFITGGPDGLNSSTSPTIDFSGGAVAQGDLADYLGFPIGFDGNASALPFRAYALIYNEWYRDQDLITALTIDTTDGTDSTTSTDLQNIAWERDYFTRARPWEQKGPAVTIGLAGTAPVKGIGFYDSTAVSPSWKTTGDVHGTEADDITPADTDGDRWEGGGSTAVYLRQDASNLSHPNVWADLTSATGVTVSALREALGLQRYEEARARYGSRYTEYLRYLGVRSSDARLQRPEYLGGGNQNIQFSEVLQTAEGTNDVGTLRGHGIAALRSNRYRRFIEEHGYVMTFISARPKTIYMEGVPRMFNKPEKEDYWQMELQHIGQQEIENQELYFAHTTPTGVFGYGDRYDEYRRVHSTVAGEFRNSTLNHWHMARDFTADPALNQSFVECVPTTRVWPSAAEDKLYIMARHSIQARRLVSGSSASYIF